MAKTRSNEMPCDEYHLTRGKLRVWFNSGHHFRFILIECFWFVVAIFDLVHDVEAIYGLC